MHALFIVATSASSFLIGLHMQQELNCEELSRSELDELLEINTGVVGAAEETDTGDVNVVVDSQHSKRGDKHSAVSNGSRRLSKRNAGAGLDTSGTSGTVVSGSARRSSKISLSSVS